MTPRTSPEVGGMGHSIKRKEDPRFIRGRGTYVDDVVLPGMLWLDIVRSPHAHAKMVKIDSAKALAVPGVLAVITGQDLAKYNLHWMPTWNPKRTSPVPHVRPFVSALVLAAGASTRLGQPKQLLPLGSTTMLGAVLSEARAASALDEVVVVLGGAADEVRRQVDLTGITVVENPQFREGCASSHQAGLAALDPRAQAVAVLLGDQPGVDRTVIDAVVDEWRRTRDPVTLVAYQSREGHPLVFARSLFPDLVALHDKAAWKIVDAHRPSLRPVVVDRPYPRDVNPRQEYEAFLRDAVRRDG